MFKINTLILQAVLVSLALAAAGCHSLSTSVSTNKLNQREKSPDYRVQPTLEVLITPPESFKVVKGYQSRLQLFLDAAGDELMNAYGFTLKGVYRTQHSRSLTLHIRSSPSETPTASHYGTNNIDLLVTHAALASANSSSVVQQLQDSVRVQLGIPQSCLNTPLSAADKKRLRRLAEVHLDRDGERVMLRQVTRSVIAREALQLSVVAKESTSCLNSVSAEGHRQLWTDLLAAATDSPNAAPDLPKFLHAANQALRNNDPAAAYSLCRENAETKPQTGAARCAAHAAQQQKRYPEAIRMWRAHLSFHPNDRDATLSLARCVGKSGDDDGARAVLMIAINKDDKWVDARVELGIALYRLSMVTEARAQWRKALELNPAHKDAQRLLDNF